jgi:F-type H+-transporting ATPase subunit delta
MRTAAQPAARPYARALWDLAKERGQVDAVGRELELVAETIGQMPALRDLFLRPWVAPSVKEGVAREVAGRLDLSPLVRDFIALLVRQGRGDQLAGVAEVYRDLVDEDLGRLRAHVRTAVPLTEEERQQLRERLGRALGGKQVVLTEAVDRELLGGFVAEVGSYIVDGSLDGQLARMRERLAKG